MDFFVLEIDWVVLVGVVLLLSFPATLLYPAEDKDRLEQARTGHFRLERVVGIWQHWLDLGRAFAGTYLLANMAIKLSSAIETYSHEDVVATSAILTGALICQTVNHRKHFYFTAPVFFIWGMVLALAPLAPALFSIIFSSLIARLADSVELKLTLMGVLLAVSGYLVAGFDLQLIATSGLVFLPLLLAFASMQHLVFYSRKVAVRH